MSERMVLFGGTFDPVHHGHLIVARSVAEQLSVDRITFMPTATPPHKRPAEATAQQRLAMLNQAVGGEGLFEVCDLEIARPGPSYTLDTVRQLRGRIGSSTGVSLVIGADMLSDLPTWRSVDQLLDEVQLIVALRPPWDQTISRILGSLEAELGPENVQHLKDSVVKTPLIDISSSDIRRRVREGRSIRFLVPPEVERFIAVNGIYGGV